MSHHIYASCRYPVLGDEVKVLCLRMEYGKGGSNVAKSICMTVQLSSVLAEKPDCPGAIGWEKNLKGNMGPRMADLSSSLDPIRCRICYEILILPFFIYFLFSSLWIVLRWVFYVELWATYWLLKCTISANRNVFAFTSHWLWSHDIVWAFENLP